jgi:hypothetical protein
MIKYRQEGLVDEKGFWIIFSDGHSEFWNLVRVQNELNAPSNLAFFRFQINSRISKQELKDRMQEIADEEGHETCCGLTLKEFQTELGL